MAFAVNIYINHFNWLGIAVLHSVNILITQDCSLVVDQSGHLLIDSHNAVQIYWWQVVGPIPVGIESIDCLLSS